MQAVIALCLVLLLAPQGCLSLKLVSHFSQHGVSGTVTFHRGSEKGVAEGKVVVTVRLSVAEEYAGEYSWGVYQFPIDYSVKDYCHSR